MDKIEESAGPEVWTTDEVSRAVLRFYERRLPAYSVVSPRTAAAVIIEELRRLPVVS